MAARNKLTNINLLPQEDFEYSTRGRVTNWLLNTFRYLVIITEIIVIAAFLSRFYFDSRLNDLNDQIDQKSKYIASQSDFEKRFRQIQIKLSIFSTMTAPDKTTSPIFDDIVAKLPADVSLKNIDLKTANQVNISGSALSDLSIQQFLVNLSTSQYFSKVNLAQMESKQDSAEINFAIQAEMNGGQQ